MSMSHSSAWWAARVMRLATRTLQLPLVTLGVQTSTTCYRMKVARANDLKTRLAVPLLMGGDKNASNRRAFGVINLLTHRKQAFFEAETRLVRALAVVGAYAIQDLVL